MADLLYFLLEEIADVLSLLLLKVAVHHSAAHGLVEIHLKAVEFGAVHAGELCLAADGETAAAAHACTIDHDGIHGNDGLDAEGLGGKRDEFHHDQRTDGDDLVVLLAFLDQALERNGDNALFAVAAVVGHDDELVGRGFEFILENQQILVAEADDGVNLAAQLVQLLRDGQSNGAAHAAADNSDLPETLGVSGFAERADEILNEVALVLVVEQFSGSADDLENYLDGAFFLVTARDGKGNSFSVLIDAQDDELSRLRLPGDERSLYVHHGDGGIQFPF